MLAEYSDDEIEVVLAHELAHHVHGDIWKGILFESVLILAGFYLASEALRVLARTSGPLGLHASMMSQDCRCWCWWRGGFRWSWFAGGARHVARVRAERRSLRARSDPQSRRLRVRHAALGAQNLAEEHPSKIVQWLFYTTARPPSASPRHRRSKRSVALRG